MPIHPGYLHPRMYSWKTNLREQPTIKLLRNKLKWLPIHWRFFSTCNLIQNRLEASQTSCGSSPNFLAIYLEACLKPHVLLTCQKLWLELVPKCFPGKGSSPLPTTFSRKGSLRCLGIESFKLTAKTWRKLSACKVAIWNQQWYTQGGLQSVINEVITLYKQGEISPQLPHVCSAIWETPFITIGEKGPTLRGTWFLWDPQMRWTNARPPTILGGVVAKGLPELKHLWNTGASSWIYTETPHGGRVRKSPKKSWKNTIS